LGRLAADPGVKEGDGVALVILGVGLRGDGECLAVAPGDDSAVGVRVEQVLHREVGERQCHLSGDAGLTPAERQLNLVVGLGLQIEYYIDCTVRLVGLGTDVHVLGVEVSSGCDLACGTHQVGLAEQVARTDAQLAADHLLVQLVVAVDHDAVDTRLRTLYDAHLQRDGVSVDALLDGDEVEEQVSVVCVEARHGVLVLVGALVQHLLVVDVAGIHTQHGVKRLGGVDCVAYPVDVGNVIFLALVHVQENVDGLVVEPGHGVVGDFGVAVTKFVVLVDDALAVVGEVLVHEFLLAEQFQQVALLVGLLHGPLQLAVRQDLVALDVDLMYLHSGVAVDVDGQHGMVFLAEVGLLRDGDDGVLEAFLVVVLLDDLLGAVDDVGGQLLSLHHSEPLSQVFLLAALGTVEPQLRHSGLLLEADVQPYLVAGDLVDVDLHLGVESLAPEALHGVGDVLARNLDLVADGQTGVTDHHIVVSGLDSGGPDAGDLVGLGQRRVYHFRVVHRIHRRLGLQWQVQQSLGVEAGEGEGEEESQRENSGNMI